MRSLHRTATLVALAALGTGCSLLRPPCPPAPASARPAAVSGPASAPPDLRLPARGRPYAGDPLSLTLAPHAVGSLTSRQALDEVSALLRGRGFLFAPALLTAPPGDGALLPKPDLAALAEAVCAEELLRSTPRDRAICAALTGAPDTGPPLAPEEAAWVARQVAALRADADRGLIEYSFPQRVEGIPIESGGILALRREGESLSYVHGSPFESFAIGNRPRLAPKAAIRLAVRALARAIGGPCTCGNSQKLAPVELVLLPHGMRKNANGESVPELRYAFRTLVAVPGRHPAAEPVARSWKVWADAETGRLLERQPQFAELKAQGTAWRRDPTTPREPVQFEVDPAPQKGGYRLQLQGVFGRLDVKGNQDFKDGELVTSAVDAAGAPVFHTAGASAAAATLCGGTSTARQVHAYSHLYRFWRIVTSAGTLPAFPEWPIDVWIDRTGDDNIAPQDQSRSFYDYFGKHLLWFTDGSGSQDRRCPNAPDKRLAGALDATTLAHELGHLTTQRLQERRPSDWCQQAPCPLPAADGRTLFHDFADAYAEAYASTPCMGGWSSKNSGGPNAALACHGHSEPGGGLPRLADASDRFPEHRNLKEGEYADGQIAAAALWFVRQGMRSRSWAAGTLRYWILLNRSLWQYGFLHPGCQGCDRDIERYLRDLLQQMVVLAAGSPEPEGRQDTYKILSGFARAGIFLVPTECIDGFAGSGDPAACPLLTGGEAGGDAVVAIDDDDPADDPRIDGVVHTEVDYLRRGGPPPTFRVWTGPAYRFDGAGSARSVKPAAADPALCNTEYQVEVSRDAAFSAPVSSGWRSVAIGAGGAAGACSASWTPTDEEWKALRGGTGATTIYYRAATRSAGGKNARSTSAPAAGQLALPPAEAVVNATGKP